MTRPRGNTRSERICATQTRLEHVLIAEPDSTSAGHALTPGEWHSPWFAYNLEPTKEVVRKALRYHRDDAQKRLSFVTTEMINLPDYADNARFSLIGQNAAIARFVRDTWADLNRPAAT